MSQDTINVEGAPHDQLAGFATAIEQFRIERRRIHFADFGVTAPMPLRLPRQTRHTPGSRLPRRVSGNGVSVECARHWLGMCEILCRGADDFDHDTRRGWVIACRLLGLGWNEARNALSDVGLFGAEMAAAHWAPFLGWADDRFVGFVYTAEAAARSGIIKVGFSCDPGRRMRQLERGQHSSVRLLSTRPATMLHEWALHQILHHAVEPEWYPADQLPVFLRASEERAA